MIHQVRSLAIVLATIQTLSAMQQAELNQSSITPSLQKKIIIVGTVGTVVYGTYRLASWYKANQLYQMRNLQLQRETEARNIQCKQAAEEKFQREEALRQAARDGDQKGIHQAIKQGVNVDAPHPQTGTTALVEAVVAGHPQMVELLVSYGASIEQSDLQKKNALYYADKQGNKAICEIFERYHAEALFRHYAFNGNRDLLLDSIYKGVNINAQNAKTGDTALHKATETDIVDLLLSHGARTDIRNFQGYRADDYRDVSNSMRSLYNLYKNERIFRNYAQHGELEQIQKMFADMRLRYEHDDKFKFDLDAPCPLTGETALILAVKNKHAHIVSELLHKNACILMRDKTGKTAKEWAEALQLATISQYFVPREFIESVKKHSLEDVKEFIETGKIRIDQRIFGGIKPIYVAAFYGNAEIVNYLFSKGADVDDISDDSDDIEPWLGRSENDKETYNEIGIIQLVKRDEQREQLANILSDKLEGASVLTNIVKEYLFEPENSKSDSEPENDLDDSMVTLF